jgi:hypothetical protein
MAYRSILRFIGVASLMFVRSLAGAQIAVKHPVGALHGFLTIRSQAGSTLGYGELSEFATGDLVTSHLVYHFSMDLSMTRPRPLPKARPFSSSATTTSRRAASFPSRPTSQSKPTVMSLPAPPTRTASLRSKAHKWISLPTLRMVWSAPSSRTFPPMLMSSSWG